MGNQTLKDKYPHLYNIVWKKLVTVAYVFSTTPLNISFRRFLAGVKLIDWYNLVATILNFNLPGEAIVPHLAPLLRRYSSVDGAIKFYTGWCFHLFHHSPSRLPPLK
uniref:Uncharacterized protein n=1 Tax=Setaria viridis TaxID=4556 RepID=A0A4U6WFP7_SETVI|nr:hypothetical protein SEVIR_1G285800v2 [Setaria viridis]